MEKMQGKKSVLIILISLVALFLLYLVVSGVYTIYKDSKQLLCDELPAIDKVNRVLADHASEKQQVEAIFTNIEIDTERCPGKAELIIHYETAEDRSQIKQIIGDTFFDIPYLMRNN